MRSVVRPENPVARSDRPRDESRDEGDAVGGGSEREANTLKMNRRHGLTAPERGAEHVALNQSLRRRAARSGDRGRVGLIRSGRRLDYAACLSVSAFP
jgi:hypothetical protein